MIAMIGIKPPDQAGKSSTCDASALRFNDAESVPRVRSTRTRSFGCQRCQRRVPPRFRRAPGLGRSIRATPRLRRGCRSTARFRSRAAPARPMAAPTMPKISAGGRQREADEQRHRHRDFDIAVAASNRKMPPTMKAASPPRPRMPKPGVSASPIISAMPSTSSRARRSGPAAPTARQRQDQADGAEHAGNEGAGIPEFEQDAVEPDHQQKEGDVRIGDRRQRAGAPVGLVGVDRCALVASVSSLLSRHLAGRLRHRS